MKSWGCRTNFHDFQLSLGRFALTGEWKKVIQSMPEIRAEQSHLLREASGWRVGCPKWRCRSVQSLQTGPIVISFMQPIRLSTHPSSCNQKAIIRYQPSPTHLPSNSMFPKLPCCKIFYYDANTICQPYLKIVQPMCHIKPTVAYQPLPQNWTKHISYLITFLQHHAFSKIFSLKNFFLLLYPQTLREIENNCFKIH